MCDVGHFFSSTSTVSWTEVKHIIPRTKKRRKTERRFIVIHWLVQRPFGERLGRHYAPQMPRCLGLSVCVRAFVHRPVKQFKSRVNAIHQIVSNCEENSKTIWLPNAGVLSVRWDTLVPVWRAAGGPIVAPPGAPASFVPSFHALRSELWAEALGTKKVYKGAEELAQNVVVLWHPRPFFLPGPDLCFSHKFGPRMEEHVGGSRSHDTHLGFKRLAGVGTRSVILLETQRHRDRAECVTENLNSSMAC